MTNWIERAERVLPGGGFGNFDPSFIVDRGEGSRIWDVDGNEYIDYLIGSGPMLLGHGHPEVVEAVNEQLSKGFTFFATSTKGIELAEVLCDAVPCADQLRFVSTGGEADMYAMRLARAFTGRRKIVKFEGGYHGMSAEAQMSLMPSKLVNFPNPEPDSAGILESVKNNVLVAPYNDKEFIESLLAEHGDDVAGIIVEPFQRIVPPEPGYLEHLRALCDQYGIVLIFDEVVTGFRLAYGGAQETYGVIPDICTLGKTIGGGHPLAAVAGRKDIMSLFDKSLAKEKWLMQYGTLSGNPVASVAGLKTLEILARAGQYEKLRKTGRTLKAAYESALNKAGVPFQIVGDDTLFDVVFTDKKVLDYRDTFHGDQQMLKTFTKHLLKKGIFKASSKLYVHLGLTDADMEQTIDALEFAAANI